MNLSPRSRGGHLAIPAIATGRIEGFPRNFLPAHVVLTTDDVESGLEPGKRGPDMPTVEERLASLEARADAMADLRTAITDLRGDTNRQFTELRGDMNRQFTEVRDDMNRRFDDV